MQRILLIILTLCVVGCTKDKDRKICSGFRVEGSDKCIITPPPVTGSESESSSESSQSNNQEQEESGRNGEVPYTPPVIKPYYPPSPVTTTTTTTTSSTTTTRRAVIPTPPTTTSTTTSTTRKAVVPRPPTTTTTRKPLPKPPEREKEHIEEKKKKAAIYCMTKMETNQLQDLHKSPNMNVLYLKVPVIDQYDTSFPASIELSKIRKSDYVTVQPGILKDKGNVEVTSIIHGQGISIKFIPHDNEFIESELELKVFKGRCFDKVCVKENYLSPFFVADGGAYIYLVKSEHPTHFNDRKASCHFSKEVLELMKNDLFDLN